MTAIRRLAPADKHAYSRLMEHAYPGFSTEVRERAFDYRLGHDDSALYGAFVGDSLAGSYRRHRYTMNLRGAMVPIGGLGAVAVGLPFKKRHVCLEMVRDFHRECLADGALLSALYPFRPDFYARMGYGLVGRLHAFTLDVTDFPRGDASACAFIEDEEAAVAWYNQKARERNGLFVRDAGYLEMARFLGKPPETRVGVWREGRLRGMFHLSFDRSGAESPFHYDLVARELLWDSPADLRALLAFIRAQEDQVQRVRLYTFDPDFRLALGSLHPPKPGMTILDELHVGETLGYGLMTRVLDVKGLMRALAEASFNGASCEAVFEIEDDLVPGNAGRSEWVIEGGRLVDCHASASAPVLGLSIADFSAFICGAVSLQSLWRHGRLEVSSADVLPALDRAFQAPPPECWTIF